MSSTSDKASTTNELTTPPVSLAKRSVPESASKDGYTLKDDRVDDHIFKCNPSKLLELSSSSQAETPVNTNCGFKFNASRGTPSAQPKRLQDKQGVSSLGHVPTTFPSHLGDNKCINRMAGPIKRAPSRYETPIKNHYVWKQLTSSVQKPSARGSSSSSSAIVNLIQNLPKAMSPRKSMQLTINNIGAQSIHTFSPSQLGISLQEKSEQPSTAFQLSTTILTAENGKNLTTPYICFSETVRSGCIALQENGGDHEKQISLQLKGQNVILTNEQDDHTDLCDDTDSKLVPMCSVSLSERH